MMQVGQTISVLASFSAGMKPLQFRWSGRIIKVKEITYTWKSREGQKDIFHFSVTDGDSLYELTFDTRSLLWRLEHIEA
ncbi:MAG: hypothetical protein C0392_12020 [Syntrophus sp. (in: bacteria)]|nr:hypothetical protein [Syntrophus sp. (in: bacteria)]